MKNSYYVLFYIYFKNCGKINNDNNRKKHEKAGLGLVEVILSTKSHQSGVPLCVSLLGWQEVQLCLMVFQVVPIRDEMSLTFTRLVCAVHKWLHFSTTMTAHTWALSSKPGRFCPPAQAVAPRRCCPPDSKREFWEISLLWLLCGESYEPRKVCRVRWNSQDGEKRYRLHLYTIVQFF